MKKVLKQIVLLMLAIVLPINVLALDEGVTTSTSALTVDVGSTKTFTITSVRVWGEATVTSSNTSVATVDTGTADPGKIWLMLDENSTNPVQTFTITVTGVSVGTATISVVYDVGTTESETLINRTDTISVTVKQTSKNNNLSSITIDGKALDGFSPSKTTYDYETENDSINIAVTREDTSATIESKIGIIKLDYGKNKIEIKVKAERGDVKTYTLNVNRIDNRDTNNYLNSLSIDKGSFTFSRSKVDYTVEVEADVEKITISAVPESNKAKVTGIEGEKTLKYGDNKFEIKVTAENETVKLYTLTVKRKDDRDSNNYLKSLTVDNGTLVFDKETLTYTFDVNYDVEKVKITAIAESDLAKVTGDGEKTLKKGSNKFEIKVTAENETVKTYTVTINKLEKDETVYIKSLTIDGVDITFDPTVLEYYINLDEQSELKFNYELEDGVTASIEGNENLVNGSIVTLKLTKGEKTKEYKFNVNKKVNTDGATVIKGTKKSKFWILYLVLGIVLLAVAGIISGKRRNKKDDDEVPETPTPDFSQPTQPVDTNFDDIPVLGPNEQVNNYNVQQPAAQPQPNYNQQPNVNQQMNYNNPQPGYAPQQGVQAPQQTMQNPQPNYNQQPNNNIQNGNQPGNFGS